MSELDLSQCDAEPIHIPGTIQPHGALLGALEADLEVQLASANAAEILGCEGRILGRRVSELLDTERLQQALRDDSLHSEPLALRLADGRPAHALVHRSEGLVVIELEPAGDDESLFRSGYRKLIGQLDRMRHSSSVAEVSQTAAEEVRALTGYDRVMVYRFDHEANGQVTAEARAEDFSESYLGLHFPATDIPAQARRLYVQNPIRIIVDASYEPVPLIPELNPLTQRPLDLSQASLRSVSPIHCRYLLNMGVRASMSISLLSGDELWGLIACHHRQPLHMPYGKRLMAELFAVTVSARIVELERLEELTRKSSAYAVQADLIGQMVDAPRFQDGLAGENRSLIDLIECRSAAVLFREEVTRIGDAPEETAIRRLGTAMHRRAPDEVVATDRLTGWIDGDDWPVETAAGCIAVPISADGLDYLFWFRAEQVHSTTWAGNPGKAVVQGSEGSTLSPRSSFEAWVEEVRGRSRPWAVWEVEMASDFRTALVASIIHQATELKRLNTRLIHAGQQRDRFLATVSHELRNPLNAILGWVEVARLSAGGDPLDRALEAIENSAVAQTELVNDLLDIGSIESGQFRLEFETLNFSLLVREALRTVEPNAKSRSITIESQLNDRESDVIGDPHRLKQVIWNLLTNSIKFSEPESRILVQLGREESVVTLTVEDEGIGISPDLLPSIFEPFKQGLTPKRRSGLGLGLSIVKSIVELHAGRIMAESEGTGHGARFTITLPVATLRPAREEKERPSPAVDLGGSRLLVVEDHQEAARMVAILLESHGAVVEVAGDGRAALAALRRTPTFDLVVSDLEMPEMDGFGLIAEMRADPHLANVPAIALTAFSSGGDRAETLTAGFRRHLAKPVDPQELIAVVAGLLNRLGE